VRQMLRKFPVVERLRRRFRGERRGAEHPVENVWVGVQRLVWDKTTGKVCLDPYVVYTERGEERKCKWEIEGVQHISIAAGPLIDGELTLETVLLDFYSDVQIKYYPEEARILITERILP